jgi:hypothetical protein
VQEERLELGDGLDALAVHPPPQPAPQRRRRVLAEVEAVAAEDPLEEQLDLDLLEVELLSASYW